MKAQALTKIQDQMSVETIGLMTQRFVERLKPEKVYLFGSFADGTYTDDSDYDFYIVVDDNSDLWSIRSNARKAIRDLKNRPVDIVVGTSSRFKRYGPSADSLFGEGEVFRKGMLLYDRSSVTL